MNAHEELLQRLYSGFQRRDGDAMAACYHPDATFSDPVFQHLRGEQVTAMWRMLAARSKDLRIEYRDIHADEQTGTAAWDATYTFSATRRVVHNHIQSTFRFAGDSIIEQRDTFDLWRWAAMALGARGSLLGWTPFVRGAIRKQAMSGLDAYMRRQSPGQADG